MLLEFVRVSGWAYGAIPRKPLLDQHLGKPLCYDQVGGTEANHTFPTQFLQYLPGLGQLLRELLARNEREVLVMHAMTRDLMSFLSDLSYQLRIPLPYFTKDGKSDFGVVLLQTIQYPLRCFHNLPGWFVRLVGVKKAITNTGPPRGQRTCRPPAMVPLVQINQHHQRAHCICRT